MRCFYGLALACGAAGGMLASGSAGAAVFSKVVDTGTLVPSAAQAFDELSLFDAPAIDNGNVVFRGLSTDGGGSPRDGIYTNLGGSLRVVAQTGQLIPDGNGDLFATGATFGFSSPSISGNNIVFQGHSPNDADVGIYAEFSSAPLETIIDSRGGSQSYTTMASPAISGGNIAFWSFFVSTFPLSTSFPQIQLHTGGAGGSFSAVASEVDTVLGKNNPLRFITTFDTARIDQDGDDTVFIARDTTGARGLYRSFGALSVGAPRVYDGDPIPDGNGATFNIQFTQSVSADGGLAAFIGGDGTGSVQGVYLLDGFNEGKIADLNTPAPDAVGNFTAFFDVSIEGTTQDMIFSARDGSLTTGLYARHNGVLTRLLSVGETLDGKVVADLDMGHEALDGTTAVFSVVFADASEGIYTVDITTGTIPEPAVVGLLALGGLALAGRRRAMA